MNKLVKGALIIFGFIILGSLGYLIFPKSYIKLSVAPSTVTVKIDDGGARLIKTGQTILVAPGTHTYVFTRDEFAPLTVKLTAGNNETKEILEVMDAQTDAARELLKNDTASFEVQQRVGGRNENKAVTELNQNYSILDKLPIYEHSFAIVGCPSQKYPDDASKMALCVSLSEDAPASAVNDYITSLGYNPNDYEIIIQGNETPPPYETGGVSDDD